MPPVEGHEQARDAHHAQQLQRAVDLKTQRAAHGVALGYIGRTLSPRSRRMRIISTFLPPETLAITSGRPTVVMAFDTLVDEKSHVVGITVGSMQGPDLADVLVSELGQAIIDRCTRHLAQNYPQAITVIAGVASVGNAVQRVRRVLAKAPPQSFVLLLCVDNKVYDAAFPALGVDFQSANMQPH